MLLTLHGPAFALVGDSYGAFGLDGSLRNISGKVENYKFLPFFGKDRTSDAFSQTLLRITALGRPTDVFSYEIHVINDLTYLSSASASSGVGVQGPNQQINRYRAFDDRLTYWSDSHNSTHLWTDRAAVKFSPDWGDITIGRQAVTFGKAYFWNPLDVYQPFDPSQFDRDYKSGVDAIRIDLALGNFSGATLICAAGRDVYNFDPQSEENSTIDMDWYGSSILARIFTNYREWDFAAQGGKVYGGWHSGGGLVGELKSIEFRAEGAYFWAEDSPALPAFYANKAPLNGLTPIPPQTAPDGRLFESGFTGVAGLGHRFENSIILELEYLYNQNGADDDPVEITKNWTRLASKSMIQVGRHLLGASASYQYSSLTTARLGAIYSLSDKSVQIQPSMTTSMTDDMELIVGGILNFGERPSAQLRVNPFLGVYSLETQINSEFGAQPHTFFIEGKFYF